MKKLFMVCTLVLLVLSVSSRTQANPTITTCVEIQEVRTQVAAANIVNDLSGQSGTYFVPAGFADSELKTNGDGDDLGFYRWHNEDWGWTHTFSPPELMPDTITSAYLDIDAFDVESPRELDNISIGLGGTTLGGLVGGDKAWSTTTFDLSGVLDELTDGTIDIWMDIDSTHTGSSSVWWAVALRSSTLRVNYEAVELVEVEVPCPQQPIPAPGAILLGSMGIGIVGWLRRRRTL